MDIIDYLASDNYIIVNKSLIQKLGLEEAVLLGELCAEYRYWVRENKLENGMFYSTIENIESNTGLTAHQQRQAIKNLEKIGVLDTDLKGVPAKKYFKINTSTVVKILTTSSVDFLQLDVKNFNLNNNKNNNTISKDIVFFKNNKKTLVETTPKNTDWFVTKYHDICVSLPKVMKVTERRKKAIDKIMKLYSQQEIILVFENAQQSDFLKGKNDRGWKADIDFILRPDKFVSILEGKYGTKTRGKTGHAAQDIEHLSAGLNEQFTEETGGNNGTKF